MVATRLSARPGVQERQPAGVGEQLRGDVDVFAPGLLGLGHGHRQLGGAAHAGELDQHRQVDAGDDLDIGAVEDGDGEIGGRAAEHVGEQHDAIALLHLGHAVQDVAPALLHIVVGADADGGDALLRAHDMLQRGDELRRQAAMRDKYHADHRSIPSGFTLSHPIGAECSLVQGTSSLTRAGRVAMAQVDPPAVRRSQSASRSATKTERCRPPVQPTAKVR